VNAPTSLSTKIVPPCCWVMMSQLIERPNPVPSPVGLVVKNGWKQALARLGRDAGAVVAQPDLDLGTEVARGHFEARLECRIARLIAALIRSVKPVADQVQENAQHVLRHHLERRRLAVEIALQGDLLRVNFMLYLASRFPPIRRILCCCGIPLIFTCSGRFNSLIGRKISLIR
jgi:hypothetical protein